jgi:hypothetical protein
MRHRRNVVVYAGLCLAALWSGSVWSQAEEKIPWYEQGRAEVRIGAYFLNNNNTLILLESTSNPLAGTVNFQRDLGINSRSAVARVRFAYQFNAQHRFDMSYFSVDRDGFRPVVDREIGFGDITIPVGASVRSHFNTSILKLTYTNIFHNSDKVRLGFTAGINWSHFDVGARFERTGPLIGDPQVSGEEQADGSGPLPVLGGRVSYSISPKWLQLSTVDILAIDTGKYSGVVTDIEVGVENRITKNFGWGIGFEFLNIDLNTSDGDLDGSIQNSTRGVNLYVSAYL